jgi:hypothetical protein
LRFASTAQWRKKWLPQGVYEIIVKKRGKRREGKERGKREGGRKEEKEEGKGRGTCEHRSNAEPVI